MFAALGLSTTLPSTPEAKPVLVANKNGAPVNKFITDLNPKGIKPCCACPETKQPRDDCFLKYGPEAVECKDLMQAHKQCMQSLGFNI